jgi:methylthioribose-1-phosphate isomerase
MEVKTIEWKDGKVIILDQRRLPSEVIFLECGRYHEVADAIKRLAIRGAPAIGIAAAMGIALGALGIETEDAGEFRKRLDTVFAAMLDTRPTAVNIQWVVNRLRLKLDAAMDAPVRRLKEMLAEEGQRILDEDVEVNKSIGKYGADLIKDGDTILTHCNAGGLATGGYGTATAPLFTAREQGKRIQVIADETRPVLQGARLTAWELMQAGIPVTLITDNAAGALMKNGEVNLVIVGTDRTVRNGDVANKIGTYPLAILSKEHGIPFYVAAPLSSIDLSIPSGEQIPIEERDPAEVTRIAGKIVSEGHDSAYAAVSIAPDGLRARNIAFDVTPGRYITAIITEKGVFRPDEIAQIKDKP